MRYVLGIDAGGTKTRAVLADETGQVVGTALGGGANLKTHGELEVEKVLHHVAEVAESRAGFRPEAVALGIACRERPSARVKRKISVSLAVSAGVVSGEFPNRL